MALAREIALTALVAICLAISISTLRYARRCYWAQRVSDPTYSGLGWLRLQVRNEWIMLVIQALLLEMAARRILDAHGGYPLRWDYGVTRAVVSVAIAWCVAGNMREMKRLRDG